MLHLAVVLDIIISPEMEKDSSIPRRRSKKEESPSRLVVYLSKDENMLIERAASVTGRSKSAFGADAVIAEARRILSKSPKN